VVPFVERGREDSYGVGAVFLAIAPAHRQLRTIPGLHGGMRDMVEAGAQPARFAARQRTDVQLIGRVPRWLRSSNEIDRVARSDAKVLITGESGVGKEVVARTIHLRGPRASEVFTPVNCAGIPETLLESELFGHVKGSFTGAYRDKPGKLESAHMGTAFVDEIGDMPLRMQWLLLRFPETGEFRKWAPMALEAMSTCG
jgi:transcriptional regulator with GAF, ATPase, and Fis domain